MNRAAAERHLEFGLVRQADKIRVVLVFFLIIITVGARPATLANPELAGIALSLAALASIWSLFFLRWDELLLRGRLPLAVVALNLFDIGWMGAFVIASGGATSPFWAMLLLTVVFAGAFFSDVSWALPFTAVIVALVYVGLAGASGPSPILVWDTSARLLVVFCVAWFTWGLATVLERERQANQRIVRYLTEGVTLLNRDGVIILANPQMAKFCGLGVDDIVGKHILETSGRPGYALLRKMLGDVLKRPASLLTTDLTLEGKQVYDLRCSTVPCGSVNGKPLGWVVVVQDVTDIKARTRMREEGLGLVSHELRSPLASLRVMAQVLSGMAGELNEEERDRVTVTIERETDRLSRLVADLLDLARLEQPDFVLEQRRLSLPEVADRVADIFSLTAESQGLTVINEVPNDLPAVWGDLDRVVQVLTNLMDNALKHTPRGGQVRLGADSEEDGVRIWVRDAGCGIPPEMLEHIFEKFGQAPHQAQSHAPKGVGLGLYVSRMLAHKQGGDLYVSSEPGEGSTFTLVLPRVAEPVAALRQPISAA